jgi:hypothetical protein
MKNEELDAPSVKNFVASQGQFRPDNRDKTRNKNEHQ